MSDEASLEARHSRAVALVRAVNEFGVRASDDELAQPPTEAEIAARRAEGWSTGWNANYPFVDGHAWFGSRLARDCAWCASCGATCQIARILRIPEGALTDAVESMWAASRREKGRTL